MIKWSPTIILREMSSKGILTMILSREFKETNLSLDNLEERHRSEQSKSNIKLKENENRNFKEMYLQCKTG